MESPVNWIRHSLGRPHWGGSSEECLGLGVMMVGWKYGSVWFFSGNPARFDGLTRCFISGNPPGHRSPKKPWFIIIFPNKLVVGGGKSSICRRTPYEQPLGFTKDACQTTLKGLYSWKHVRLVKGWSCLKQVNHRTTSSNHQIYWQNDVLSRSKDQSRIEWVSA